MPTAKETGWRCPQCGRRFRQRTREHSCEVRSLDAHVQRGSPVTQATFTALERALAKIGPHAMVPVKTMILLRASANFAGIVIRRDSVQVEFLQRRLLPSGRIHKTDRLGKDRYTHHVRLSSPAEVDGELIGWLKEAHQASTRR